MSADAKSKRPLTQLNHEIEAAEAEAARLESERKVIARDASRSRRCLRFLRLAQATRRPTESLEFWPTVLLLAGSGVFGVVLFVIVHLLFGSFAIAFVGLLIGAAAGAGLFAALLYRPADALLPGAIDEAETQIRLTDARMKEKTERITETKDRLQRLLDERRDQIASGKLQKAALLQRPWKSMEAAEWEDFVVEVCRTLGATVERIRDSQGPNLIVEFDSRRIAVVTQAREPLVDSPTVRRAIEAAQRLGCHSSAAITNRRFTGQAQHFAQLNGCRIISTSEFPDFVLGKIEL